MIVRSKKRKKDHVLQFSIFFLKSTIFKFCLHFSSAYPRSLKIYHLDIYNDSMGYMLHHDFESEERFQEMV